jgi:uncharacterized RDD family membrane protein YckC
MNCPRCHEGEVDFSGICLYCGYHVPLEPEESEVPSVRDIAYNAAETSAPADVEPVVEQTRDDVRDFTAMEEPADKPEIPQWRIESTQRAQEVRQKKEDERRQAEVEDLEEAKLKKLEELKEKENDAQARTTIAPRDSADAIRAKLLEKAKTYMPPSVFAAQQKESQPSPEPGIRLVATEKAWETVGNTGTSAENIKNVIDAAVARQGPPILTTLGWAASGIAETTETAPTPDFLTQTVDVSPRYPEPPRIPEILGTPEVEDVSFAEDGAPDDEMPESEGRLIFLSRTLSGLVDLVLIFISSGLFLVAADYFSNTPILNAMSVVNFSGLFLVIYFLYSFFFLVTNGQTIGMMTTDLRIVGIEGGRVSLRQVARRNVVFLVSLFGLGLGLLMGLFNRDHQCLHDKLSETNVVRI